MKKIIYLSGFLSLMFFSSFAQQVVTDGENYYDDSKGIVYNKEFTVDLRLHTNGYALGVNIGTLKTFYLTRFFNFEIGEIKHVKQYRQSFDFQAPTTNRVSRAFVFGKQNNLFVLRAGLGEKRYFSEKAKRKGLAIGVSYEGGVSLGLLKPYYLELRTQPFDPIAGEIVIRSEKFSEENADIFLDISKIYGASGFSKGLNEVKVLPGLHGKFSVHFDWGAFDEFVKAIEAGFMVDAFFQKVPIMVESPQVPNTENRPFFINLFLNLQLGKRW